MDSHLGGVRARDEAPCHSPWPGFHSSSSSPAAAGSCGGLLRESCALGVGRGAGPRRVEMKITRIKKVIACHCVSLFLRPFSPPRLLSLSLSFPPPLSLTLFHSPPFPLFLFPFPSPSSFSSVSLSSSLRACSPSIHPGGREGVAGRPEEARQK